MGGRTGWNALWRLEDWWSVWLGGGIIALAVTGLVTAVPKIGKWTNLPALGGRHLLELLCFGVGLSALTVLAVGATGGRTRAYLVGFPGLYGLAIAAYVLGNQALMRHYGLNDVIWALGLGILISNTAGRPAWLRPALRSELFIKTGLVLLGAEILFYRVLSLGLYGLGVAWVVTPVVIYFMYVFGTRTLRIPSRALVATIAATTSVCGVSAAIAAGAATRARREEISYAISVSLIFTVFMMLGLPVACRFLGLGQAVSGAWIGGTVDSTGAVVAAGAMIGPTAMQVAAVVKMIQNVLIGVVAFVLATLWVTRIERGPDSEQASLAEVWRRFPKFILGFAGASLLFSAVLGPLLGSEAVDGILKVTGGFRGWLFCLAFASIGLETNLTDLGRVTRSGRPLVLYVVGQLFNLVLTLMAAWALFSGRFFPPVR